MKLYSYLKYGLIIFSIFSLCCSCSFLDKKNDKESGKGIGEPNNTILEAGILKTGEINTMKIDTIGDIDWYAIPVSGQGYLTVSTKKVPENLNLQVRFAEKQAWEKEKHKWYTDWNYMPHTISVEKSDTLYFAIIDNHNDEASDEEIEFKVDFIEEFDEYEPNDQPDEAVEVASGELMRTAFFPKSDVDWFKIDVDTSGYLMIRAKSVPEPISVIVRYATRKSEFDKVEYIKDWQTLPAGIQVTEPGTYYFSLIDNHQDAMSQEKAEWKVDFIEEMDPTEPNNSFKEAYAVTTNDTVQMAIFPKGDVDIFKLTPEKSAAIRISADAPGDIKLQFRLHVIEDFEEKRLTEWLYLPQHIEVEGGKEYYFEIIDNHHDAYSEKPFELKIAELDPSQVEKEEE